LSFKSPNPSGFGSTWAGADAIERPVAGPISAASMLYVTSRPTLLRLPKYVVVKNLPARGQCYGPLSSANFTSFLQKLQFSSKQISLYVGYYAHQLDQEHKSTEVVILRFLCPGQILLFI
jgi:hypothetical protein